MSVRLRKWKTAKGGIRQMWVADYKDHDGIRRLQTFADKGQARRFEALNARQSWSQKRRTTIDLPPSRSWLKEVRK